MRIALFGGTFDPIHYGHLICAEEVREAFAFERVWFVPAHKPPHKSDDPLRASAEDRYRMVCAAVEGNPAFEVSRSEIDREGVSYAIDTVRAFQREFGGDARIYWIMGVDALAEIETWRDWRTLAEQCRFVAVTRPGYADVVLRGHLRDQVETFKMTGVDISSTRIRDAVQHGRSIRYRTPQPVIEYIESRGLYQRRK